MQENESLPAKPDKPKEEMLSYILIISILI